MYVPTDFFTHTFASTDIDLHQIYHYTSVKNLSRASGFLLPVLVLVPAAIPSAGPARACAHARIYAYNIIIYMYNIIRVV